MRGIGIGNSHRKAKTPKRHKFTVRFGAAEFIPGISKKGGRSLVELEIVRAMERISSAGVEIPA